MCAYEYLRKKQKKVAEVGGRRPASGCTFFLGEFLSDWEDTLSFGADKGQGWGQLLSLTLCHRRTARLSLTAGRIHRHR